MCIKRSSQKRQAFDEVTAPSSHAWPQTLGNCCSLLYPTPIGPLCDPYLSLVMQARHLNLQRSRTTPPSGAVFPGDPWPIPMIDADFPCFTTKIVEHSRYLPPGTGAGDYAALLHQRRHGVSEDQLVNAA